MIQLAGPLRRAHQALPPCAPWSDMPGLERVANARVEELRRRLGRDSTTLWGPVVQLNEALRTQALEHFDEPDYPEHKRLLLARQLHRFNSLLLSYHRFLAVLEPLIERAAAKRGAPARLLELASGSGEFSMGLARLAQRKGLPLQVTGSDIQPAYVAAAQAEATRRGLPMRFEQRNAFDLGDVSPGEFDLVFIANTLHHFTPGQLAMMVAQGSRVAGTAFVGMDGYRSLWLLGVLATLPLLITGSVDFLHDSVLTGRKFYALEELRVIATAAAPEGLVKVRAAHPGYTVLTVKPPPTRQSR